MNKMDITIMHINACKTEVEAWEKVSNPVEGFGYKLTKNEQTLCYHYIKLLFREVKKGGK